MITNQDYQARIEAAWPKEQPLKLSSKEANQYRQSIKKLLIEKDAVLIAHYYTDAEIQKLAEDSGGFVGDSLEMAKFGANHQATTLVIAGVKFMGETSKILSPEKTVLMPDFGAECSMDIGCDIVDFKKFIKQHSDRTVVVYANTSAAVKACSDWVVTSSIAIKVVDYLSAKGEKILWAPDKYLGDYIQKQTDADMVLWQGSCIVHEEFQETELAKLKQQHPESAILAHPESPAGVIALADVVGSTSQLLESSKQLTNTKFIVATDSGIFYKMQQQSPSKEFIAAPTLGPNATCRCCAKCPWMKTNNLKNIAKALEYNENIIELDEQTIQRSLKPLQRMVEFNYETIINDAH